MLGGYEGAKMINMESFAHSDKIAPLDKKTGTIARRSPKGS